MGDSTAQKVGLEVVFGQAGTAGRGGKPGSMGRGAPRCYAGAPSLKKDLSYGHGLAESPKLSFEKDSVVLCCDYNYNCLFCSFCFFSKMASYKDFH